MSRLSIEDVEKLNNLSISDYTKALYKNKLLEGVTKVVETSDVRRREEGRVSFHDATKGIPKSYVREFAGGKNPYLLFVKNTAKESTQHIHTGMVLADRDSDRWVNKGSVEGAHILEARKVKRQSDLQAKKIAKQQKQPTAKPKSKRSIRGGGLESGGESETSETPASGVDVLRKGLVSK